MPKDLVVHLKKKTPPFTFSSFHVLFGCLMIASPNSIANERFDRRVPIIDHVHDDKKRGGRSGGWGECTSALRITKVRRGGKMFGVSASFSPFHRCEMKGLGGWLACVRACVCVCVCVWETSVAHVRCRERWMKCMDQGRKQEASPRYKWEKRSVLFGKKEEKEQMRLASLHVSVVGRSKRTKLGYGKKAGQRK